MFHMLGENDIIPLCHYCFKNCTGYENYLQRSLGGKCEPQFAYVAASKLFLLKDSGGRYLWISSCTHSRMFLIGKGFIVCTKRRSESIRLNSKNARERSVFSTLSLIGLHNPI